MRLVNLPSQFAHLEIEWKCKGRDQRFGQYVWNQYGQTGVDGNTWPELFYADDRMAKDIVLQQYYI